MSATNDAFLYEQGGSDAAADAPTAPKAALPAQEHGWQKIQLQRFQVPFHDRHLAEAQTHRITLHLAGGPVLIERTKAGHHDRRWSKAGCSNLIPAGAPVTRSCKGIADFLALDLSVDLVNEIAAESFRSGEASALLVESIAAEDATIGHLGHLLLAETTVTTMGRGLYTDSLACALATHLLRHYSASSPQAKTTSGCMIGWRLRRVVDYMHSHLDEDLALAQLAKVTGLGSVQFARTFREATGETPYKYLTRLRVDLARHLLEHTIMPVSDIGVRCGYEQPNHFATMFRKATGTSPRSYRRQRHITAA